MVLWFHGWLVSFHEGVVGVYHMENVLCFLFTEKVVPCLDKVESLSCISSEINSGQFLIDFPITIKDYS